MSSIRKWDIQNPETKKKCIDQIMQLIDELEGRPAGVIASEELMNAISSTIGPDMYNMALIDVKKVISEKMQDLDVDIDLLTQS